MRDLTLSQKINLRVDDEGAIKGVFANTDIKKGEKLEECVLIVPKSDKWEEMDEAFISHFIGIPHLREDSKVFADKNGGVLKAHVTRPTCGSGYSMVYSKAKKGNLDLRVTPQNTLIIKAARKISTGEELILSDESKK